MAHDQLPYSERFQPHIPIVETVPVGYEAQWVQWEAREKRLLPELKEKPGGLEWTVRKTRSDGQAIWIYAPERERTNIQAPVPYDCGDNSRLRSKFESVRVFCVPV